ncbi:MAG: hypothetical protein GTN80_02810 [Nitrososphaeria archaeon]|nr:hypothetical protein [Nitrososphaeria archaeon]NIN52103.1 hypothetical protein [Nitrososphaeria archaeon]NIQ32565.1 hypothetical protein [Nitrososphaeria archaeon]
MRETRTIIGSDSLVEVFKIKVEKVIRSHTRTDAWRICQEILYKARRVLPFREYVAFNRYVYQRLKRNTPIRMKSHGWKSDPIFKALGD